MKPTTPPTTIDAYISSFPSDVQAILQQIRSIVRAAAPDAEEAIKYRVPTFVLGGNLVHFAAFAHHTGLAVVSPNGLNAGAPL